MTGGYEELSLVGQDCQELAAGPGSSREVRQGAGHRTREWQQGWEVAAGQEAAAGRSGPSSVLLSSRGGPGGAYENRYNNYYNIP